MSFYAYDGAMDLSELLHKLLDHSRSLHISIGLEVFASRC